MRIIRNYDAASVVSVVFDRVECGALIEVRTNVHVITRETTMKYSIPHCVCGEDTRNGIDPGGISLA